MNRIYRIKNYSKVSFSFYPAYPVHPVRIYLKSNYRVRSAFDVNRVNKANTF